MGVELVKIGFLEMVSFSDEDVVHLLPDVQVVLDVVFEVYIEIQFVLC